MAQTKFFEERKLDLDSVASILWNPDLGYLLQHREDIHDIAYPGWWCLFGGAREEHETPVQAIRRELLEELELDIPEPEIFFSCAYDLNFESRYVRKFYFISYVSNDLNSRIVLNEGQGLKWVMPEMLIHQVEKIVPFDVAPLMLHKLQQVTSARLL